MVEQRLIGVGREVGYIRRAFISMGGVLAFLVASFCFFFFFLFVCFSQVVETPTIMTSHHHLTLSTYPPAIFIIPFESCRAKYRYHLSSPNFWMFFLGHLDTHEAYEFSCSVLFCSWDGLFWGKEACICACGDYGVVGKGNE